MLKSLVALLLLLGVVAVVAEERDPDGIEAVMFDEKGNVHTDSLTPFKKVAEEKGTPIACISREVGEAILDAYKESQEQGEITLVMFIMLGACEIVVPGQPEMTSI